MFKKYRVNSYKQINLFIYSFNISIFDSEFDEEITVEAENIVPASFLALIAIYSKRKLNIDKNFYLLFNHYIKKLTWSTNGLIKYLIKNNIPSIYIQNLNKYFQLE